MSFESKHADISDKSLIAQYCASGDNRWIGILLDRYTMLMLGVAMKYLRNLPDAEDAVQQVFERIITYKSLAEIDDFKAWL